MRLKTIREETEKLKNELNITSQEASDLFLFIKTKHITKERVKMWHWKETKGGLNKGEKTDVAPKATGLGINVLLP